MCRYLSAKESSSWRRNLCSPGVERDARFDCLIFFTNTGDKPYGWVNETKIPTWVIYVLKQIP